MTITGTIALPDGRTTRLFVRSADDVSLYTPLAEATFMDDGDHERESALRVVLNSEVVCVDAHAGIDPADVQHVFVRPTAPDSKRIFACVIVTEARVEKMLESEPCVLETFSFQVSSGRIVTPAGTIAAFETWVQRVFPELRLPIMCFANVSEAFDAMAEADWSDVPAASGDATLLPTSFEDVASLVAA